MEFMGLCAIVAIKYLVVLCCKYICVDNLSYL